MAKSLFSNYLQRYTRYPRQIPENPDPDTALIVVIPCLNEPWIFQTLNALWACERPEKPVEVLIAINHSSDAPYEVQSYNAETWEAIQQWSVNHKDSYLRFYPLYYPDLRPKIAGVGSGRKAGMDEAIYRFDAIGQEKGIIACLDADCDVAPNYLQALQHHFQKHETPGCSIYFEHPLDGERRKAEYEAILDFELYLRYYKNAFYWTGFPYSYHTIGSCMAARADAYCKVGGMNKQKAGEDFYFLKKLIYQGHFTELNETRVIPSPRKSLRVPFGTGQVVTDYIEEELEELQVFNPELYKAFKAFMEAIPTLYQYKPEQASAFLKTLPEVMQNFLNQYDFTYYMEECQAHSSDQTVFLKRFFHWFDAFMALKFLHFGRDHHYHNVPVTEAVTWLIGTWDGVVPGVNKKELLQRLRIIDKEIEQKPNPLVPF